MRQPFNVKVELTDREIGIVIYREYAQRKKIHEKKVLPSELRDWSKKVNMMVEVFNWFRPHLDIPQAKEMQPIPGVQVKGGSGNVLNYLENEIRMRQKFYPEWVRKGKLSQELAYINIQRMKLVYNKALEISQTKHGRQSSLFK